MGENNGTKKNAKECPSPIEVAFPYSRPLIPALIPDQARQDDLRGAVSSMPPKCLIVLAKSTPTLQLWFTLKSRMIKQNNYEARTGGVGMRSIFFKLSFLTTLLISAFQVNAEEVPDNFKFRLGTFFVASNETEVQVNSGSIIGVIINTSDDLDVKTKKEVLRLDGYYRFNDRDRVDYGWYKVKSSGTRTLTKEIVFQGETFSAGVSVESIFNTETFKVNYAWSFHHDDKVELSLGAGLHITKYEIALSGETLSNPGVISREESNFTLPLPVIGFRLGYNINSKLEFTTSYDLFSLSYDQYEGNFVDANLLLEYRFSKHVGISGGFNFNHLDLTYQEGQTTTKVNDTTRGAVLFLTLTY